MKNLISDDDCNIIKWTEEIDINNQNSNDDDDNEEDDNIKNKQSNKKLIEFKYKFYKHKKGILPQLVHKLVMERRDVQKLIKDETDELIKVVLDKRQWALKISANSVFGFLGVVGGKLPLPEGARSITAKGRELITFTNNYLVDKYNAKIRYNDTDSTMFNIDQITSHSDAIHWGHKLEKEVSDQFPDPLQVEFEKAGRMFCIKKKKYAFWVIDEKTNNLKIKTLTNILNGKHKLPLTDIWKNPKQIKLINSHTNSLQSIDDLFSNISSDILWSKQIDVVDPISNQKYTIIREIIPDIMTKGIILARRDNCLLQRKIYNHVLQNIMIRTPLNDTYDYILKQIFKLYQHRVNWKDLIIIRELGSNYSSPTFFMKIFGDELRRIGKPHNPGDRIEYLIVNSSSNNQLLGYKLRLPETYLENLNSDSPEHIDYDYYLEKTLMNCIEQLFQIGYKDELSSLHIKYDQLDRHRFLLSVSNLGYSDLIQSLYNSFYTIYQSHNVPITHLIQYEIETQIINYIRSNLKNKTQKLYSTYISHYRKLSTRIDNHPIKNLLKLILERKKYLLDISTLNK